MWWRWGGGGGGSDGGSGGSDGGSGVGPMTSVEKLIALDDEGAIENWAYEAKEAIDQAVPVAKLELARVKALRAATPGSIRSMHDFLTSSSSGGGSSSKVEGNDIHKPACGNEISRRIHGHVNRRCGGIAGARTPDHPTPALPLPIPWNWPLD